MSKPSSIELTAPETTAPESDDRWQIKHLGYSFAIDDEDIDYKTNLTPQNVQEILDKHEIKSEFSNLDVIGPYLIRSNTFPKDVYFSGVRRLATGIFFEFWSERRPRPARLQKLETLITEILRGLATTELVNILDEYLEEHDDPDFIDQRYLTETEAETLREFVLANKET